MAGGDLDKNSAIGVVGTEFCLNWAQERRDGEKNSENLFSRLSQWNIVEQRMRYKLEGAIWQGRVLFFFFIEGSIVGELYAPGMIQ